MDEELEELEELDGFDELEEPAGSVSIYANMIDNTDDNADFLAERGVDFILPEGVNPKLIMGILFEGFGDRLKEAGIEIALDGGWT